MAINWAQYTIGSDAKKLDKSKSCVRKKFRMGRVVVFGIVYTQVVLSDGAPAFRITILQSKGPTDITEG